MTPTLPGSQITSLSSNVATEQSPVKIHSVLAAVVDAREDVVVIIGGAGVVVGMSGVVRADAVEVVVGTAVVVVVGEVVETGVVVDAGVDVAVVTGVEAGGVLVGTDAVGVVVGTADVVVGAGVVVD